MRMRSGRLALSVVLAAGLLAGCQSSEERAQEHLESALALVAQGDVERATVEFRNVFRLDPQNRDAHMAFAAMLEERGALAQAYGQYAQVIEKKPDDLEALRAAARIAAMTGSWTEARTHVTAALALDADAPDLLAVKAGADYAEAVQARNDEGRVAAAATAATLLAGQPDNLLLHQLVIDNLIRNQDFAAAERAVDAAIAIAPQDKGLYTIRISVLLALQDEPAVEEQLKDLVTRFPDDPAMGATLLRWYVSRNELDKAEAYLRATAANDNAARMDLVGFLARFRTADQALAELDRIIDEAEAAPPADPATTAEATAPEAEGDRPVVTLATFRALRASLQFDQGERDAAIAEMQAILAGAEPSDETRRVKVTLARMLFTTGDAVAARALVEEVLAEDAVHLEAIKLKAAWLIEGDQVDEAVALLRAGLDANPRDTQVMTLLAQAYERLGNRELMGDMLSQAVTASNKAPEESVRYANFLAADQKFAPAETVLVEALRLDPANLSILQPLGQVYVAMQDWSRATGVADRLEEIASEESLALARSLRAAILQGQQKTDEAVGYLQSLVEGGDAGLSAQVAIIRTYLDNGEAEKAKAFAAEMLAKNPTDPSLRFIEATVRSATGDNAAAEATFRALVAEEPGRLPVWLALVRHLAMSGDPAASRAALDEALAALPEAGDLLMIKAGYLEQDHDIPGAIAIYEKLYTANSSNQILANNLASLMASYQAEDPANIERAWVIARRLRGTTVPAFADTYGWIAHLRGDSAEALTYMEPAAKGLPQDPLVQFHLAEVYRALSRPEEAKAQYSRVLELVPESDTRPFVVTSRQLATGNPQPDPPKQN
jgi:tetratricopeptide (TPR) repeat protein